MDIIRYRAQNLNVLIDQMIDDAAVIGYWAS
jgi:hypothetical protein